MEKPREDQVGDWLEELGMSQYKQVFRDAGILDLGSVMRLNTQALSETLGIQRKDHKNKLAIGIRKLMKDTTKQRRKVTAKMTESIDYNKKKCTTLRIIWKTKVEKPSDVEEFYSTTNLAMEVLERISKFLEEGEIEADLTSELHQLQNTLDQYKNHLLELVKGKKLSRHLDNSLKRSKIERFDMMLRSDIISVLEASGISNICPITPRALQSVKSLPKEAQEMWIEQFNDQHMVLWETFYLQFCKWLNKVSQKRQYTSQDEILLKHVLDNFDTGYVTPYRFACFLTIFGPLPQSFTNLWSLFSNKWFYSFLSVQEVYSLLSPQSPGTFIIRFSSSHFDSLVLEYVEDVGVLRSVLINCQQPLGFTIKESDDKEITFSSVTEIITHYTDVLTRPLHADFINQRWFAGDVRVEEVRDMLAKSTPGTFLIHFGNSHCRSLVFLVCTYCDIDGSVKQIWLEKVYSGYRALVTSPDTTIHSSFMNVKSRPASMYSGNEKSEKSSEQINAKDAVSQNSEKRRSKEVVAKEDLEKHATEAKLRRSLIVFPSVNDFIQTNRDILRYNYDEEGVPTVKILPLRLKSNPLDYFAPEELATGVHVNFGPHISASTTSTYPVPSLGSEVLCDAFKLRLYGNRVLFALADGCNWGLKPRAAAHKASNVFVDWMTSVQSKILDTSSIKHYLLLGFEKAHEAIIEGLSETDLWGCGTTTLLGGMFVESDPGAEEQEMLFVCASVGDCKAFHWCEQSGIVTDVTYGNRCGATDARDCGGRLGPYLNGGQPDLRNLRSFFKSCKPGDLVIAVSDGVHDNLDPQHMGLQPADLKHLMPIDDNVNDWEDLKPDDQEKLKSLYSCNLLSQLITDSNSDQPADIVSRLIQHAVQLTSNSRDYMEKNPTLNEPMDYTKFPGKMDHTTALVFKPVPSFENWKISRVGKEGGASGSTSSFSDKRPVTDSVEEKHGVTFVTTPRGKSLSSPPSPRKLPEPIPSLSLGSGRTSPRKNSSTHSSPRRPVPQLPISKDIGNTASLNLASPRKHKHNHVTSSPDTVANRHTRATTADPLPFSFKKSLNIDRSKPGGDGSESPVVPKLSLKVPMASLGRAETCDLEIEVTQEKSKEKRERARSDRSEGRRASMNLVGRKRGERETGRTKKTLDDSSRAHTSRERSGETHNTGSAKHEKEKDHSHVHHEHHLGHGTHLGTSSNSSHTASTSVESSPGGGGGSTGVVTSGGSGIENSAHVRSGSVPTRNFAAEFQSPVRSASGSAISGSGVGSGGSGGGSAVTPVVRAASGSGELPIYGARTASSDTNKKRQSMDERRDTIHFKRLASKGDKIRIQESKTHISRPSSATFSPQVVTTPTPVTSLYLHMKSSFFPQRILDDLKKLERVPVKKYSAERYYFNENHSGTIEFKPIFCGKSISTYPIETLNEGVKRRLGDPIPHAFCCDVSNSRLYLSMSCGRNWGQKARDAAQMARTTWESSLSLSPALSGTYKAALASLVTIEKIHNNLVSSRETVNFLACMAFKLSSLEANAGIDVENWFVLCPCVGDSKLFVLEASTQKITEITTNNVTLSTDTNSASSEGKLGSPQPDLSNLSLFSRRCRTGDILIAASSNFYLNFDPLFLGLQPSQVNLPQSKWEDVPDLLAVRSRLQCAKMEEVLGLSTKITKASRSGSPHGISSSVVTTHLLKYCKHTTEKTRGYMEQNPSSGEPLDKKIYPGKLGHTTCLAVTLDTTRIPGADLLPRKRMDIGTVYKSMQKTRVRSSVTDPNLFLQ
eukprot:TRINITY_DN12865_c0_g1_i1.p1 TRINITY_DN12865_c0_g1~~TRINITY_DN12865_c0_g1_i1.p1  ORF type:complete len:1760 (-),score=273.24 TRINITY_DN12865_c0_g1_i1:1-5280(-)